VSFGLAVAYRELHRYGARMLDDSIIVLDSSAVLRLYEYPPLERNALLNAFDSAHHRLWVPNRTYLEVRRRRDSVRARNRNAIRAVEPYFAKLFDNVRNRRDINEAYDVPRIFEKTLARARAIVENMLLAEMTATENAAFEQVDKLIDLLMERGRQAPNIDSEDFERLLRIGPNRMRLGVPPGFEDFEKKLSQGRHLEDALGDLILWEEIVRFASKVRRPILFVTGEEKRDWWDRTASDVKPHHLLVEEMLNRSDQKYGSLRVQDFVALMESRAQAELLLQTETIIRLIPKQFAVSGIDAGTLRSLSEDLAKSVFSSMVDIPTLQLSPAATEFTKMMQRYAQLGLGNQTSQLLRSAGLTETTLRQLSKRMTSSAFSSMVDIPTLRLSPAATEAAKMMQRSALRQLSQGIASSVFGPMVDIPTLRLSPAATEAAKMMQHYAQLDASNYAAKFLKSAGLTEATLRHVSQGMASSVFSSMVDIPTSRLSMAATEFTKMVQHYGQMDVGNHTAKLLKSAGLTETTLRQLSQEIASSTVFLGGPIKLAKRKQATRKRKARKSRTSKGANS
jgi:hypothetical protein